MLLITGLSVVVVFTTGHTTENAKIHQKPTVAKVANPGLDNNLEFTAKELNCGKDAVSIDSDVSYGPPNGEYCALSVTVRNTSNDIHSLSVSDQYLLSDNDTYSGKPVVTGIINKWRDESDLLNKIQPGDSVSGVIVFDVPQKVNILGVRLHESENSSGVHIKLRRKNGEAN